MITSNRLALTSFELITQDVRWNLSICNNIIFIQKIMKLVLSALVKVNNGCKVNSGIIKKRVLISKKKSNNKVVMFGLNCVIRKYGLLVIVLQSIAYQSRKEWTSMSRSIVSASEECLAAWAVNSARALSRVNVLKIFCVKKRTTSTFECR